MLAGLALLLIVAMGEAATYFARASLSQTQLATVSEIEAIALDPSSDRSRLLPLLGAYAHSVDRERHFMDADGGARQDREATDAARVTMLVQAGAARDGELRATVARIATRERGEAADMAAAIARLRRNTSILAGLLALAASALGAAGGVSLLTANRRLEREVAARTRDLSASNNALVEIDKSRRLFFAKVSHELRTPVTVMRGEADVALAGGAAGEARDALHRVVVQSDVLARRIEELLELARADDGRIALTRAPVDLAAIVREAARIVTPYARSAEVALMVEGTAAATISGDVRWLGQALLAILDNAVKFSPMGGIVTLAIAREGEMARVTIGDEGIGIVPEALPRIFDAYYQADTARSRGGSGLGLALARWVVEQHGGTIDARPLPGRGCAITMLLPVVP